MPPELKPRQFETVLYTDVSICTSQGISEFSLILEEGDQFTIDQNTGDLIVHSHDIEGHLVFKERHVVWYSTKVRSHRREVKGPAAPKTPTPIGEPLKSGETV